MGQIKILPNNIINQIAAGEVIERPASVIKELVENSIDAGASRIDISVWEGGHQKIEIRDNGCGMGINDLKLAFVRHATSKIINESDLYTLLSLGFRGEALPSIAAVSKLSIISRTLNDNAGYKLNLEAGELIDENVIGCPTGTTIVVKDLFFNTPARLKFMGSPRAESQQITYLVQKLALSHPNIAFRYYRDDREISFTNGSGDLLNVITALYDTSIVNNLVKINHTRNGYTVSGFISNPNCTRANRRNQYFFVNKRIISDGTIRHALESAYGNMLATRRYPIAFIHIDMPTSDVDVNVHPTKSEVRFARRSDIHALITAGVKEALSANLTINSHLTVDSVHDNLFNKSTNLRPEQEKKHNENLELSFREVETNNYYDATINNNIFNKKVDSKVVEEQVEFGSSNISESKQNDFSPPQELTQIMLLGQIHSSFIVLQNKKGLLIIDQHAAHERVLIEILRQRIKANNVQYFAVPITLSFSKIQFESIKEFLADINKIGIIIEPFGTNSFIVRGIPDFLSGKLKVDDLRDIICDVFTAKHNLSKWYDNFLINLSCKSAVKIHQTLSRDEMMTLITNLAKSPNWKFCPHGRPTVWEIPFSELERKFKRI